MASVDAIQIEINQALVDECERLKGENASQHDRDSAELRRLCQERDNLRSTCRELRLQFERELERHRKTFTQLEQALREMEGLRQASGEAAVELCKASDWICREVEVGTRSATHWAIRLNEDAANLRAAMQEPTQ